MVEALKKKTDLIAVAGGDGTVGQVARCMIGKYSDRAIAHRYGKQCSADLRYCGQSDPVVDCVVGRRPTLPDQCRDAVA